MFHNSARRHPVQTFQFWLVVLTCFVAVTAWKLDLFSLPEPKLPVLTEEPMPPPPQGESMDFAAPEQANESADFRPDRRREVVRTLSEPLPLPDVAQAPSEQASENLVRTVSLEALEHPAEVVLATEEREHAVELPETAAPAELSIDLAQADQLINAGDDVAALRLLSGWYWQLPQLRAKFADRLALLSRRIYFSPQPHYLDAYAVQFGDRLDVVGKKYRVTGEYLAKLNRLDSAPLRAGQLLKVVQGPFSAVVDISDRELTVHAQGYYLMHFPVGFGSDSSIPEGTFRITDKVLDPDYYGPNGVITHQEAGNPLGTRWMTINNSQRSLQGYGIHGTSDPALVGQVGGQGWLRLRQRDIEAVYDLLTVGSEFIIHP